MVRVCRVLAAMAACGGLLLATAPSASAGRDPFAALDRSMRDRVKTDDLAGGVLLVVRGGDVIHQADFGELDTASLIPIASASKWLTAATLMTLVDEGKVSLDEPVATYLPEFKGAKKAITVRQLLSHTSGLPFTDCIYDPSSTTAACTSAIADGPGPTTKPGRSFSYSGVGYEVAGRIIEVVTGRSFEDAFEARIAQPLGMTHTRFDEYEGKRIRHPSPAGSGVSSVEEYAKFLAMLAAGGTTANGRILAESSVAEIERDQVRGLDTRRDAAVQITGIPTYGLGVWRERTNASDDIEVVSASGGFGLADTSNGSEHAVTASQRQARVAWRAAAHWIP
jgi:CubicO group peptidase (beta-lactamase class C family)